jgi:hypothetical protein
MDTMEWLEDSREINGVSHNLTMPTAPKAVSFLA